LSASLDSFALWESHFAVPDPTALTIRATSGRERPAGWPFLALLFC